MPRDLTNTRLSETDDVRAIIRTRQRNSVIDPVLNKKITNIYTCTIVRVKPFSKGEQASIRQQVFENISTYLRNKGVEVSATTMEELIVSLETKNPLIANKLKKINLSLASTDSIGDMETLHEHLKTIPSGLVPYDLQNIANFIYESPQNQVTAQARDQLNEIYFRYCQNLIVKINNALKGFQSMHVENKFKQKNQIIFNTRELIDIINRKLPHHDGDYYLLTALSHVLNAFNTVDYVDKNSAIKRLFTGNAAHITSLLNSIEKELLTRKELGEFPTFANIQVTLDDCQIVCQKLSQFRQYATLDHNAIFTQADRIIELVDDTYNDYCQKSVDEIHEALASWETSHEKYKPLRAINVIDQVKLLIEIINHKLPTHHGNDYLFVALTHAIYALNQINPKNKLTLLNPVFEKNVEHILSLLESIRQRLAYHKATKTLHELPETQLTDWQIGCEHLVTFREFAPPKCTAIFNNAENIIKLISKSRQRTENHCKRNLSTSALPELKKARKGERDETTAPPPAYNNTSGRLFVIGSNGRLAQIPETPKNQPK